MTVAPLPEKKPLILGLHDLQAEKYLRTLIIGGAKSGKSWLLRTLSPDMLPVLVLNSDDRNALERAARGMNPKSFFCAEMYGTDLNVTEQCVGAARKGALAGDFRTIVWDTITCYAERSIEVFEKASTTRNENTDGRIYYRNQKKHLMGIIARLKLLPAHLIIMAHDDIEDEKLPTIPGQMAKSGKRIVPGIEGNTRKLLPRELNDVIYLDKQGKDRIFCMAAEGVTGPGSRALPGVDTCPADLGLFWKKVQEYDKGEGGATTTDTKNKTTQTTTQIKGKSK